MYNPNKRRTALVALLISAGVHMSEQNTGALTQILSWIDPTARGLTKDEIELARPILGDKVHYASVRVFERRAYDTILQEWIYGNRKAGTALRHFIYLHEINQHDLEQAAKDGFKGYPNRKLLLHELSHVGQYQSQITNAAHDKDYTVKIESGKPYTAYKVEQQATLVEHYYDARLKVGQLSQYFQGQTLSAPVQKEVKEVIAHACRDAETVAAAIRPHFPASPHPACIKLQISS